jgi:hypothetical protein
VLLTYIDRSLRILISDGTMNLSEHYFVSLCKRLVANSFYRNVIATLTIFLLFFSVLFHCSVANHAAGSLLCFYCCTKQSVLDFYFTAVEIMNCFLCTVVTASMNIENCCVRFSFVIFAWYSCNTYCVVYNCIISICVGCCVL